MNSSPGFLENQFLIALPQMSGSYFAQTVAYLWKHNEHGACGTIINKPLRTSVADIFDELDISCPAESPIRKQSVLAGGPIERDKGFILHDAGDNWESSLAITPEISLCTSKSILQDIAAGKGPANYLVALGCTGWQAGQLEHEIGNNAWLTVPFNPELLFSTNYEDKLTAAADLLGIKLPQVSPRAGHS